MPLLSKFARVVRRFVTLPNGEIRRSYRFLLWGFFALALFAGSYFVAVRRAHLAALKLKEEEQAELRKLRRITLM